MRKRTNTPSTRPGLPRAVAVGLVLIGSALVGSWPAPHAQEQGAPASEPAGTSSGRRGVYSVPAHVTEARRHEVRQATSTPSRIGRIVVTYPPSEATAALCSRIASVTSSGCSPSGGTRPYQSVLSQM